MLTHLRGAVARTAAVLCGAALLTGGAAVATASSASAEPVTCSISFTPSTIGPGQSSTAAITTNAPITSYSGQILVDGDPVSPRTPLGSSSGGTVPYEVLATQFMHDPTKSVTLDYQIFWDGLARQAAGSAARMADGPLCHATLTLLPSTGSTAPKLTLTTPASLPLSARTAKVRAASTATGAVALRSLTTKVCTVRDGAAVLHRAGVCTLQASQAGATSVKRSFRVWATPTIPRRATTPRVVTVLGKGEGALHVSAAPASVCRATGGAVALVDAGTCRITVRGHGHVVRRGAVKVALSKDPAAVKHRLTRGATVYFDFDSAALSKAGKASLRLVADRLRKADLVVVYGHTFGPGKNSKHSRALAERRAEHVVDYLATLGVTAKKATTVPLAMQQPISKQAWKNRRAEVYFR